MCKMLPDYPSLRWMAISLVISKARSRDPHGIDVPARLMKEMTRFMMSLRLRHNASLQNAVSVNN